MPDIEYSTQKITQSAAVKANSLGGLTFDSPRTRKALLYSLWDGMLANGMIALVDTFAVAGAIYLKAPAIVIALLAALPQLLTSVGQISISKLTNKNNSRKRTVTRGTTFQSTSLFLLALCGWLPSPWAPWIYWFLFTGYSFSGNVVQGFWTAWMGELVPAHSRGRHFAWRNRIFSIVQFVCAITAGIISRKYSTDNVSWVLFMIVFSVAGLFRLISTRMLQLQYEPATQPHSSTSGSFAIRKNSHFLYYVITTALMQGVVVLAGPFISVWFIRDLHFDFLTLTLASAATIFGMTISLPIWGKLIDSIGNRRIILFCGILIATVPIPFLFTDNSVIILVVNLYTGCCWSGYNLANFNYLLLASGKGRTESNLSIAGAINGVSIFSFSLLGGYLATHLPTIFNWKLQSLFLLSAILRFIVLLLFFKHKDIETTIKVVVPTPDIINKNC